MWRVLVSGSHLIDNFAALALSTAPSFSRDGGLTSCKHFINEFSAGFKHKLIRPQCWSFSRTLGMRLEGLASSLKPWAKHSKPAQRSKI